MMIAGSCLWCFTESPTRAAVFASQKLLDLEEIAAGEEHSFIPWEMTFWQKYFEIVECEPLGASATTINARVH